MEQKIYEDFMPHSDISRDTDSTIIHVHLKGFKKEDLKVTHISRTKPEALRITGEMAIEGNNKWRRFTTEFRIPPDCDTRKISARFEGGILSVTLPKRAESARKPDETKEPKESGHQEQQEKGQTDTKGVAAPLERKPDHHDQKPTKAVQETKDKNAEEPAASQVKGKAGISEQVSKPPGESEGQTNTASQASGKAVAPPEPEPGHQKPTDGDEKEARQEASSEAGRGGSASDPPRPRESNNTKGHEEHESGKPVSPGANEKDVSEELPKPQEPKSLTQQAGQPSELKDATGETTAGDNKKEEGETKNGVKRKGYECTFAEMRLRKRTKRVNLALLVLAGIGIGIGIGLCVKNMIKYS